MTIFFAKDIGKAIDQVVTILTINGDRIDFIVIHNAQPSCKFWFISIDPAHIEAINIKPQATKEIVYGKSGTA
jgi:hypothetical protein